MSTYKLKDFVDPIAITVQNPAKSGYERFVGLEHYDSGELVIKRYSGVELLTTNAKAFQKNDILIARRNVYLRRAGVVYFNGITSGDSIVFRVKVDCKAQTGVNRELAQKVLPLVLNTDKFWIYANKHADGMNSKRISKDMLMEYEFDLPSLDEQKVLADKLWAAYRVKEAYRQLLATIDDMLKAIFQKIAEEAAEKRLGDYIEIIRGVSFKPDDLCRNDDEGATTILRANNISNGTLNFDDIVFVASEKVKDVQLLRKGDVLMCASSGSQEHVGKVALVDRTFKDVAFGAFCMVVRAKDIEPAYLLSLLMSTSFRNHIEMMCNGTNILNVRRDYIEEWTCPIADKEVQQQFVAVATQAEATKASLRESITSIDRVIRSLINQ